jgi:hypothetical protein
VPTSQPSARTDSSWVGAFDALRDRDQVNRLCEPDDAQLGE